MSVVLALALGEIVLRVHKFRKYSTNTVRLVPGSRVLYEHKPCITFVNEQGIRIRYNSLGFIGDEVKAKSAGVFRILGIGDSITAAEYLPEEKRYINKIGTILSSKTTKSIEVVNAGVIGYNSWQEAELLRTRYLSVEPDLIIVSLCFNDDCGWRPEIRKTWFGGVREIPRHHKEARYFNFLYQRSQLYQFVYDRLYMLKKLLRKNNRYYTEHEWKPDMERWKGPLEEMMSLAKNYNTEILFVIFPLEQQILKGEGNSSRELTEFFEGKNVYFLDLIKYFKPNSDKPLYIKRDPIHPNVLGSTIAAKAIADYILENDMLR